MSLSHLIKDPRSVAFPGYKYWEVPLNARRKGRNHVVKDTTVFADLIITMEPVDLSSTFIPGRKPAHIAEFKCVMIGTSTPKRFFHENPSLRNGDFKQVDDYLKDL